MRTAKVKECSQQKTRTRGAAGNPKTKDSKQVLRGECIIPPRVADEVLNCFTLGRNEKEASRISEYVEWQCAKDKEKVTYLEKVLTQHTLGVRHDCWNVRTDKERYWVITNPTNLYSPEHFPSEDYTLSFHFDLMLRMESMRKRLAAKQVIVLLDACHSGLGVVHRGIDTQRLRRFNDAQAGRVWLAAGAADQLAFEDPNLGHGIFTYYVLQGLSGKADLNDGGYVMAQELFSYVEAQVTGKSVGLQTPWFATVDGAGDFAVADVDLQKTRR
jgi:hypothetical protein